MYKHLIIYSSAFSRAGYKVETSRGTTSFHFLCRTATEKRQINWTVPSRTRSADGVRGLAQVARQQRSRPAYTQHILLQHGNKILSSMRLVTSPSHHLLAPLAPKLLAASRAPNVSEVPRSRTGVLPVRLRGVKCSLLVQSRSASASYLLLTASVLKQIQVQRSFFKAQCI